MHVIYFNSCIKLTILEELMLQQREFLVERNETFHSFKSAVYPLQTLVTTWKWMPNITCFKWSASQLISWMEILTFLCFLMSHSTDECFLSLFLCFTIFLQLSLWHVNHPLMFLMKAYHCYNLLEVSIIIFQNTVFRNWFCLWRNVQKSWLTLTSILNILHSHKQILV